jgi:hypothetical protein
LPIVQGGSTKQVSIANVTADRAVSALSITSTNDAIVNGVTVGKGNSSIASNTALGVGAGGKFASGGTSTAIGINALFNATGTNSCVAVGDYAGYSLVSNNQNTFIGSTAGYTSTGYGNTFVGCNAFTGQGAGYNQGPGNNNTIIGGYGGSYGLSNYIWLSDGVGNVRLTCFPTGGVSIGNASDPGLGGLNVSGLIFPQQAASAPTYQKGAIYFDTTLNKLRVGGATAWETITSI